MKKCAYSSFMPGLLVALLGAAAVATGIAFKVSAAASGMFNVGDMAWAAVAAAVVALVYGFVRFDRAHAVTLCLVMAHNLLAAFGLTALVSIVFPAVSSVPAVQSLSAAMLTVVAFTFFQSFVVLFHARRIVRSTSRREVPYEEAGRRAVRETAALRMECTLGAIVLTLCIAGFGGFGGTLAVVCPIVAAAAVSQYTGCFATGSVWASFAQKLGTRRA